MKITHIEVSRVHVPMKTDPADESVAAVDDGYVPTAGLHKHIIRLHTDEGIAGLGETWKGTPDAAVRKAAEALLGRDPRRLSLHRLPLPHDAELVNARDHGELVAVRPVAHNPSLHAFEVAGMSIWRGSGLDLGILDASYAHVCAATPACTLGSDIIGQFMREDDLIVDPLVYEAGHVLVPEGPGLGVQLDEEALARYTVDRGDDGMPGAWTVG